MPGEHPQQRRLAAARRPDDGEEFAFLDVEIDAVDGSEGAERLGEHRAAREWWERRVMNALIPAISVDSDQTGASRYSTRDARSLLPASDQPPDASRFAAVMISSSLS